MTGSAPDPKVQAEFNALASQTQDENAAFVYTYDEPLSHLIYAGCDFVRALPPAPNTGRGQGKYTLRVSPVPCACSVVA